MTVQELRDKLSEFDPQAEVWLEHFEGGELPVAYVGTLPDVEAVLCPRAPKGAVFILADSEETGSLIGNRDVL